MELFFKWIKQHLRIKAFFGTSENAVKTQIWIAVSVYVLVAIVRKRLGLDASLYQILQILSLTLFEKTPILQALQASRLPRRITRSGNQLILIGTQRPRESRRRGSLVGSITYPVPIYFRSLTTLPVCIPGLASMVAHPQASRLHLIGLQLSVR